MRPNQPEDMCALAIAWQPQTAHTEGGTEEPDMSRSLLVALLASSIACVPGLDGDWVLQERTDEGQICFDEVSIETPGTIEIWLDACLSSSCSREATASCTATASGNTITLTSAFSWEENVAPDAMCTEDCNQIMASCELPALPEGTYEVQHGDDLLSLTVPGEASCSA